MSGEQIDANFEPYARTFGQHWNGHLDKSDKMFAEVFAYPINGMIGVAFYAVDRQEFPELMQIVDDSFKKLQEQFPNAAWSQLHDGQEFIEVLKNVVIIIKPDVHCYWEDRMGGRDADDTVAHHFTKTMPEEWKRPR
jgi:hypothetical protein